MSTTATNTRKSVKYAHCLNFEPESFEYVNGDTYFGEYMIDPSNDKIYRHGFGSYSNQNGLKISGNWIKDNLAGEVNIEFPNIMLYEGFLTKNMGYTVGTIHFPDGSKFTGDFKKNFENRRADGIIFHDPNGKKWNHIITDDDQILLEYDWQQDNEDCKLGCDEI